MVIAVMGAGDVSPSLAAARQQGPPGAARSDQLGAFIGRWSGLRRSPDGRPSPRDFVDLEIRRTQAGGLELIDHAPTATGFPPAPLVETPNGRLTANWRTMFGTANFAGKLTSGGALTVSMRGEAMDRRPRGPVTLHRDDPAAARYRIPRVTGDGVRKLDYTYAEPAANSDWPTASLEAERIDRAPIEEMVRSILRQQAEPVVNRTDAVLIIRHGKMVLEEYFWGYDRNTLHDISSDTKSVTSILAGIAYDLGKLRPDTQVYDLFHDLADTRWVKEKYPITLDEVLSMRAGIAWNEDLPYQDPGNTAIAMLQAPDATRYILDRPLKDTPGATYQYDSGLPTLMGPILTRAVGEPIEVFADHRLFRPLGIRDYRWARQADGEPLASGGMVLRPIDSAKLGQLMLDSGVWRGNRILSKDWVTRSTTAKTAPDAYAYGYYWHLVDGARPDRPAYAHFGRFSAFMAIGQGGQYIVVIPELSTVIVLASSNWEPNGTRLGISEIIAKSIIPAIRP
jgi:CubicO group peptidase (beta-lactamase class C family)